MIICNNCNSHMENIWTKYEWQLLIVQNSIKLIKNIACKKPVDFSLGSKYIKYDTHYYCKIS
jgi:hypothetical protein